MIRKCYDCGNIYFVITQPKRRFFDYIKRCCPECGGTQTQEFPVWVIEQDLERYYEEKAKGIDYSLRADPDHLKKIVEIAHMYETLRKLGE